MFPLTKVKIMIALSQPPKWARKEGAILKFLSAILLMALVSSLAQAGSVYDHINTPAYRAGVVDSYLSKIAGDVQRNKIIATAQDECGGRYEGTEVVITELSHSIEVEKNVIHGSNPDDYSMLYNASSENEFLVVETIQCSLHEGHAKSVLHSQLMSGKETDDVTYVYVGDAQKGEETVSNIQRSYVLGLPQMKDLYQTPYGTVIP